MKIIYINTNTNEKRKMEGISCLKPVRPYEFLLGYLKIKRQYHKQLTLINLLANQQN